MRARVLQAGFAYGRLDPQRPRSRPALLANGPVARRWDGA